MIFSTNLNNPGFFKQKFMTYIIEIQPTGTTIERRYSDFDSLRQELLKRYPGYLIPPIPKKKVGKTTETAFLLKRQDLLQRFLNEVLCHPILANSDLVCQFLTLAQKEWENRIKVMSKIPMSKNVSEFRTIQGTAKIEASETYETFCEKFYSLVGLSKDRYKVIKSFNKTIMNDFEKLSTSFSMASSAYSIMSTTLKAMGDPAHSEMFTFMCDLHKKLGEIYKGFKESFMTELVNFYRFYKYEMSSLEEIIEIQRNSFSAMNSLEKKLWAKKEHKFNQKNVITWDLDPSCKLTTELLLNDKAAAFKEMFHKETVDSQKSRMLYGFYTNKAVEEVNRIIKKQVIRTKDHLEKIPSLFIVKEEELVKTWEEFLEKMKAYNSKEKSNETISS